MKIMSYLLYPANGTDGDYLLSSGRAQLLMAIMISIQFVPLSSNRLDNSLDGAAYAVDKCIVGKSWLAFNATIPPCTGQAAFLRPMAGISALYTGTDGLELKPIWISLFQ